MITRTSSSGARPIEELRGPTQILCRYNVVEVKEESFTGYEYTEDVYDIGEYEMIMAGLWVGPWTVQTRRIERKGRHDRADIAISKLKDSGLTEDSDAIKAIRTYKQGCRATVNQEGFPEKCIYPTVSA